MILFDLLKGLDNLKKYIKIAPCEAGVYRMISSEGEVLYVGKAKNIKKRIVAYSHIDKLPKRLQQMVAQIDTMEFVVVENEARALLVENELIKKYSPKYNILLKDDKSFPYLMIDMTSEFPKISKYRGIHLRFLFGKRQGCGHNLYKELSQCFVIYSLDNSKGNAETNVGKKRNKLT